MKASDVHIVRLASMRVASVWGFGPSPENQAWQKLTGWAGPRGFFADPEQHPIYGFNNPGPSPGSPNYGYELWMGVGPEVAPEGDARISHFRGGLYAVARCEVPREQFDVIGERWRQLALWREDSAYRLAPHQWLEKSVHIPQWGMPPSAAGLAFVMDLYLPIAAA